MGNDFSDRYVKLDDFVLSCDLIEDGFEKAIARYEFPYADGALTEDMGQKARHVRLRCFFLEDDYARHVELVNHIEKQDLFDLQHPTYGLLKGRVESVTVRADERLFTAEVDIVFVEHLRGQSSFFSDAKSAPSPRESAENTFVAGQQDQQDLIAADVRNDFSGSGMPPMAESSRITDTEIPDGTDASVIDWGLPAVRAYALQVQNEINLLDGALAEVARLPNTIISTVNYATSLPGRVVRSVSMLMERAAIAITSLRTSPARFMESLKKAGDDVLKSLDTLGASLSGSPQQAAHRTVRKHVVLGIAHRMALEAGYCFQDDLKNMGDLSKREKAKAFDAAGDYLSPGIVPVVLTVKDLEDMLAITRTSIQQAIDLCRDMEDGLKGAAMQLLDYVETVKLDRERIVSVTLDNRIPLHLLCLMQGIPYIYADRIVSINRGIERPNFTAGTVSVYAAR